ncbi:hypothetical protein VZ95_11400 [Elstera litoralis]|uniref:Uncharacterized protein n=1 Tax=Elstera litoralis TaxID=552518 RepID=A0A0F3IV14_9PROT|nr:hypothetical protein VZ95_11400 [Elstera litoralis]
MPEQKAGFMALGEAQQLRLRVERRIAAEDHVGLKGRDCFHQQFGIAALLKRALDETIFLKRGAEAERFQMQAGRIVWAGGERAFRRLELAEG